MCADKLYRSEGSNAQVAARHRGERRIRRRSAIGVDVLTWFITLGSRSGRDLGPVE